MQHLLLEQKWKISVNIIIDVNFAVEQEVSLEILEFAEYALEYMQDKDKSLVLEKQLGNNIPSEIHHTITIIYFNCYHHIIMSYTSAPVIDLLIQIKNSYLARKSLISGIIPSKFKLEVCKLLQQAKFIKDFEVTTEGNKKTLHINLINSTNMSELVPNIKLFSKPSRKYYIGYEDIKGVAGGKGVGIISTNKGLMFAHEAKVQKLGGELIAEIY